MASKQTKIDKAMSMPILTPMLTAILQLKRTQSPDFPGPMGWREIGNRLGMSGQGAHYHARKLLDDPKQPRCPYCLQKLEKEKAAEVPTQ